MIVCENVTIRVHNYSGAQTLDSLRWFLLRQALTEELPKEWIVKKRKLLRSSHPLGGSHRNHCWRYSADKIRVGCLWYYRVGCGIWPRIRLTRGKLHRSSLTLASYESCADDNRD